MLFRLDLESGVPLYQQVVEQVRRMIASGTILPGDRLPTVRELAAELVVNPNTVAHAYQMLEQAGVVETRRGQGTFACAPSVRMTPQQGREQVAALLDRALAEASLLNVSAEDVLAVWRERLEEWRTGQETREVKR
ncbi:MAG: GntR family transcriptional regulator [Armatimonadota bacterium]|nr:GntR family transcriptional regulator [Armatimonadota bacterium]